jgi:glycerophosphoryl diester phosphodiesterase
MFRLALVFALCGLSAGAAPRIAVHAHRGARAVLPENTLPAFEYAIRFGVDYLEFDLAVTKDDQLVVSHDLTLNGEICTAPGPPNVIRELTLEQVRRWDCGSLKNPRFPKQRPVPGAKVPTLDEVLALADRGNFAFNIEPKVFADRPQQTPPRREYARLLLNAIRRRRLEPRVVVQSADLDMLREVRRVDPKIQIAAICTRWPNEYVEKAVSAGAATVALNYTLITPERVQAAHQAGLKVLCWTPNAPEDWDRMIAAGVDEIGTDEPVALMEHLGKRGLR